jgi:DMSO/TMAO reductase YedYZ molybdopterin-dependent catalytic subunit
MRSLRNHPSVRHERCAAHGAPLRLHVERQLGYTMAKFVARIAVVNRLDGIGRGNGGTWEDDGYEWHAGI